MILLKLRIENKYVAKLPMLSRRPFVGIDKKLVELSLAVVDFLRCLGSDPQSSMKSSGPNTLHK